MKNAMRFVACSVVIFCLAGAALAQTSPGEALVAAVARLADLLDRATYVAISGFTLYDTEDQAIAAQQLLNLFVGSGGQGYVAQSGGDPEADALGILDAYEAVTDTLTAETIRDASPEEYCVYMDVSRFTQPFLRLAHSAAREAIDALRRQSDPGDALREAYASLVAVRGEFSDAFMLAGIGNLASMLGIRGVDSLTASLQAAIDDLPSGGTLILEPGTYRGRLVLTKSITLRGAVEGETVLEASSWYPVILVVPAEAITVTIENVVISGGSDGIVRGPVGDVEAPVYLNLRDVRFLEGGTALTLGSGTSAELEDCVFEENRGALFAYSDATLSLNRCVITGSRGALAAVRLYESVECTMTECQFSDNLGRGIVALPSVTLHLRDSTLLGNYSYAVSIAEYGYPTDEDDVGCGLFVGWPGNEDLPRGEVTGYGNTICGAVCPSSLISLTDPAPNELTVASGQSIQAAIDGVAAGGTVYIEPGRYGEELSIGKSARLIGSVADSADGDIVLDVGDGPTGIVILGESPISVSISDVVIVGNGTNVGIDVGENGAVDLVDVTLRELARGISAVDGGRVTAAACVLSGNALGVQVREFGSFEGIGCAFEGNVEAVSGAMGGICRLSDCSITGCTATHAAIDVLCVELTVSHCRIYGNECSGILLRGGTGSSLHLVDSDLTGNIHGLEVGHGSCRPGGSPDWESPGRFEYVAGTITGWGNRIPGPDEPDGNLESGIFYHWPGSVDVSFLTEPKPADD